jgi:ABC-2 type transport system permease protein
MKILTMVGYGFKQVFRYRPNWFFLFILPMLLILVLGSAFGGTYTPKVGVVAPSGGHLSDDLVARLRRAPGIDVSRLAGERAMRTAVERGQLEAGVVVPEAYDRTIRAGRTVRLTFIARPGAMQLQTAVAGAVAGQEAILRAARVAEQKGVAPFDRALPVAEQAARQDPGVGVRVETVGTATFPTTLGRFDAGASSELVLFVFLMAMMAAIGLIEARRLGVVRRIMSTPTTARSILLGEGLSRLGISLVQAVVIMVGSALFFDVHWGSPAAAGLLIVAFALVGCGAAMLLGSLLRTEQQTVAVSLLLGMGLGALGGCMVPIEFFSDTMRTIAHLTPHAWALDGFADLIRRGGGVADVLPQVTILLGYATVLLGLASWRLRRIVTR